MWGKNIKLCKTTTCSKWMHCESKSLCWNISRPKAWCQIAMTLLYSPPSPPIHFSPPPQFLQTTATLAPFLLPKLNDRWKKLDQCRPSSRKPSHLKWARCPSFAPWATAQGFLGPCMCELKWERGCRLWATMGTETWEGKEGEGV